MSKAENRALEAYPKETRDITGFVVDIGHPQYMRNLYIEGYKQAEKDLELTWEGINSIKLIIEQVECDYVEQDKKLYTKYFYEEVLKRFKKIKED